MLAAICCAAIGFVDIGLADPDDGTNDRLGEDVLIEDSGNISSLNISGLYPTGFFGVAKTVKFTPTKSNWILDRVLILGWDGFVVNETLPVERVISLEVRDENLNLLYRFTDSQLPYFHFSGTPGIAKIELPPITINGDFYVCFYDRGAVKVAWDQNEVSDNSYFFDTFSKELIPAAFFIEDSEDPVPVNWLIRAVGH